jgi:hypothetical protein
MTDRKEPDPNYEIGHSRPPKATRWKKGTSGNPKGRPKADKTGPVNISAFLDEPVAMKINGKARKLHPFEAMIMRMVQQMMKGEIMPMIRLVEFCEQYDLIDTPPPEYGGGVMIAPKGITPEDYVKQYGEIVDDE